MCLLFALLLLLCCSSPPLGTSSPTRNNITFFTSSLPLSFVIIIYMSTLCLQKKYTQNNLLYIQTYVYTLKPSEFWFLNASYRCVRLRNNRSEWEGEKISPIRRWSRNKKTFLTLLFYFRCAYASFMSLVAPDYSRSLRMKNFDSLKQTNFHYFYFHFFSRFFRWFLYSFWPA